MKKLIALLVFATCLYTAQAQDKKPTKEETIAFIKRTLEGVAGSSNNIYTVTEVFFEYDKYKLKLETNYKYVEIEEHFDIKWENLRENDIMIIPEQIYTRMRLFFQKNHKRISTNGNNEPSVSYISNLDIAVPHEKTESLKKAFLRLSEIAKEENKDPFAN